MAKSVHSGAAAVANNVGSEKLSQAAQVAETIIKDTTANPAPLGLMGFGLTTILLNLHNIGLYGLGSMIISMGIFYGGIAQIIAGIMEWKKNNTFGTVAFTSYGFFWITLVGILTFPEMGITKKPDVAAMSAFLFFWGFFSLMLFLCTFKMNKALVTIFFLLTVLFFLLAIGDMYHGTQTGATLKVVAGYEGIATAIAALYTGAAQIINEVYGKTILPLGQFE